ncbi:hypothetical protein [Deinococcus multiflagellatus]|uniref:MarR family transcriptional regulator n=2 Tax=Deinococcus multiflagellatus TaxID=1656887 RepID=A0ABW1ZJZ3_9DEIO
MPAHEDHAPASVNEASQATTPVAAVETEETAATPQADGKEDRPGLSNRQRVEAWVQALPPGSICTVRQISQHLGLPEKSVATQLPKLMPVLVERVPDTGVIGIPSEYRRVGEPVVESIAEPVAKLASPEPTEPDQDEAPASDPGSAAALIANMTPSTGPALLAFLQAHEGEEFTAERLALEVGAPLAEVQASLQALHRQGTVSAGPQLPSGEQWFGLPRAAGHASAPAQGDALPTIPPRLTFEERSVFDALRREPDGLSRRTLAARLNWGQGRTDKVVAALQQAGHLGTNGDRVRVMMPPELQGQDGAA